MPSQAARRPTTLRPVAAVDRALAVLGAIADLGRPGLADIARHAGLYKSTVLRLLDSLVGAGFVQRHDDGRYRLGPQIPRLAVAYEASFSLAEQVLPVLREVVAFTGESAAFHVRQGEARVCLYRVDSPQLLRDAVRQGDVLPLERGTGGRVLLAFTGRRGAIYDAIRRNWVVALSGDRAKDLAGISAPVFGRHDELLGALTLTAPASRLAAARSRQLAPWLRRLAAGLSGRLGASAGLVERMQAAR